MEVQRNYYRYVIGLAVFLLSFGVYLSTLCPTVSELDSGELITACYTLGIAHPAGYPLYTLLGKLFTMLPIRTVAFRVNMMSAFFAALAAALMYFIILRLYELNGTERQEKTWKIGKHVIAASTGLLFAFSRAFWSYAVITEVYTMKAFFLILLILMLLTWRASTSAKKNWLLWIGAFVYGLSLGTRITMILFGPAFLLYILINLRELRAALIRTFLIMALFLFLGSCVYLYLPIRSLSNPPIDWGDPENWNNFLDHVTGKQFRFMLFNVSRSMFWVHLKEYIYSFAMQFTLLIYPIGIIGAAFFRRERLKEFVLLGGICLIDILFNLLLYTGIYWLEHFFISSFIVFAIWTGWGMKSIVESIERRAESIEDSGLRTQGSRPRFHVSPSILRIASFVLCLSFALAPLLPYMGNRARADQSQNRNSYDYSVDILDLVEDNAIIVANGINPTFPLWYLRHVEGKRPDVVAMDGNLLASHWFYDYLRDGRVETAGQSFEPSNYSSHDDWLNTMVMDIVSRNIGSRPIYLTFKHPDIAAQVSASGYVLIPRLYFMPTGPIYQIKQHRPEVVVTELSIQNKASISFSDSIEFLGYDTNSKKEISRRGEILHLTYYWKLLENITDDLTVDVLFTDEDGNYDMKNGIPVFHNIHEFVYDLTLADVYEPGQMIKEEYKLVVPSDMAPGKYYIGVGVCKGRTFLETDVAEAVGNFVQVGIINIL